MLAVWAHNSLNIDLSPASNIEGKHRKETCSTRNKQMPSYNTLYAATAHCLAIDGDLSMSLYRISYI